MASPEDPEAVEELDALLDQLSDGETRDLLRDLAARHDGAARAIRRAAASPAGRVPALRAELHELRTRRFLGYHESMAWARDAGPVIDEIWAEAERAPSRELLKLVELALDRVVKTLLRADDSSGTIGDLAQQLLEAHETVCAADVADPKALARWMVRFGFDLQDFFVVDPVRYATALGEKGVAALRQAVEERSQAADPPFAARYTEERLAVLDGDVDRVVSLLGGDLSAPYQFTRVAEAMLELGRRDDALEWASRGIESSTGWQVGKLYDLATEILLGQGAESKALDLRREQHQRMPTSATYATLRKAASDLGVWDVEQAEARVVLAARDVGGLVDALLADRDVDAAWEAATAASDDLGDSRWALLAEAHEPSDPGAAFEVYLRLAESTLLSANRQAYQKAATQLKAARRAAATAERSGEFDDRLSTLRVQYRRRPALITILDKAGLVP